MYLRWIVIVVLILMILAAAVFWTLLFSGNLGRAIDPRGDEPGGGERGGAGNRLDRATSPYLLQHADNPVAWKPWGAEAFDQARREDKPIFLSVGYATCHWCHVMAHESFEDERVAALLNEHFVAIKVDREQLPDVDGHYMLATQAFYMLAGQARGGGWPNSVWLMPDGRPFYAGTYFPKPQFTALLQRLAELWRDQRDALEQNAAALTRAIESLSAVGGEADPSLSADMLDEAVGHLRRAYDERHGGFGGAPKFPPHGMLDLIAHRLPRAGDAAGELRRMFVDTLDAMQRGGVYDHIGGGFHRYATDGHWFLPHFEKMLYDNGQLLTLSSAGYRLTGDERHRRTVGQTWQWLKRRMRHERGGFYSAMDADSEGEEGRYYVWSMDELRAVLGEEGAAVFGAVYGFGEGGNWTDEASGERPGTNIPHLPRPIDAYAEMHGEDADALRRRLEAMRQKLLAARRQRVPPATDDKVLAGWNGLVIEGLAEAGAAFGEAEYIEAAKQAAEFVLEVLGDDEGGLRRSWRGGVAQGEGYLDDYAFMAGALLALHQHAGEACWLERARALAEAMIERFGDEQAGGFFYTAAGHDTGGPTLLRSKSPHAGGNTPSPNGRAACVLLTLAARTGEAAYARRALGTLRLFAGQMAQHPHGSEDLLIALDMLTSDDRLAALAGFEAGEAASTGLSAAAEAGAPIAAELETPDAPVSVGETTTVTVRLHVEAPYHIYGPAPGSGRVQPTRIELLDGAHVALGEPRYPQPELLQDAVFGESLRVYRGEVSIDVPLTVRASEGGRAEFTLQVEAQPCDDAACRQPTTLNLAGRLAVVA